MTSLDRKLKEIFAPSRPICIFKGINQSFLHQLNNGFSIVYQELKPQNGHIVMVKEGEKLDHILNQEKFMVALAKMLMYTEKFAGLKFSDK
uniref:Uncharacterized protein n=1 Tax=Acrobeloides nanus TaxID=290746 RepID=A0A914CZ36_9BILA